MKPKTVKIIKSGSKYYWYNNKIGELFDVRECKMESSRYEVIEKADHTNPLIRRISTSDCVEMTRRDKIERIKKRLK